MINSKVVQKPSAQMAIGDSCSEAGQTDFSWLPLNPKTELEAGHEQVLWVFSDLLHKLVFYYKSTCTHKAHKRQTEFTEASINQMEGGCTDYKVELLLNLINIQTMSTD